MESNAFRAITIGAGVLIAIMTISLVMTYYNAAKESMSVVGSGNNVYEQYERSIRDILTKTNLYGTDVVNLYNYFGGIASITFNINGITATNKDISNIMPNQKFKLSVNDEVTNFEITTID